MTYLMQECVAVCVLQCVAACVLQCDCVSCISAHDLKMEYRALWIEWRAFLIVFDGI